MTPARQPGRRRRLDVGIGDQRPTKEFESISAADRPNNIEPLAAAPGRHIDIGEA